MGPVVEAFVFDVGVRRAVAAVVAGVNGDEASPFRRRQTWSQRFVGGRPINLIRFGCVRLPDHGGPHVGVG